MVTDEGGYDRFGALSRVELERFFYLDDEDRRLIAARRRDYNRLGFALQVVTVRQLGMFLADPLDVPPELIDYLAGQLGIEESSCVKQYTEREKTKLEHARNTVTASASRTPDTGAGKIRTVPIAQPSALPQINSGVDPARKPHRAKSTPRLPRIKSRYLR